MPHCGPCIVFLKMCEELLILEHEKYHWEDGYSRKDIGRKQNERCPRTFPTLLSWPPQGEGVV